MNSNVTTKQQINRRNLTKVTRSSSGATFGRLVAPLALRAVSSPPYLFSTGLSVENRCAKGSHHVQSPPITCANLHPSPPNHSHLQYNRYCGESSRSKYASAVPKRIS